MFCVYSIGNARAYAGWRKWSCLYSKVKILGTVLCVSGAVTMSLCSAAEEDFHSSLMRDTTFDQQKIIGCFHLIAAVLALSSNSILQVYSAEVQLITSMDICFDPLTIKRIANWPTHLFLLICFPRLHRQSLWLNFQHQSQCALSCPWLVQVWLQLYSYLKTTNWTMAGRFWASASWSPFLFWWDETLVFSHWILLGNICKHYALPDSVSALSFVVGLHEILKCTGRCHRRIVHRLHMLGHKKERGSPSFYV